MRPSPAGAADVGRGCPGSAPQKAHAIGLSTLEVHAWAGILRRQRSPAPWAGTAEPHDGPARLGRTVGRHGSTARWDRTASSWNSSAAPRAGPAAPLAWTQPQRARLVPWPRRHVRMARGIARHLGNDPSCLFRQVSRRNPVNIGLNASTARAVWSVSAERLGGAVCYRLSRQRRRSNAHPGRSPGGAAFSQCWAFPSMRRPTPWFIF